MGMKNLRERKVVITGAASGIGRELALAFARERCDMVLADIDEAGLQETVGMVNGAGGSAEAFFCDVSKADQVTRMADRCFDKWGRVDLLINNAGVASTGFMGDVPITDWEWVMSINFWGVVYGCHAFVPGMKGQGEGHIVNVASAAGIISSAEMAPYNASKAAVISLSETLKSELAPYGIGVTVLCPTFVRTNLLEKMRFTDDFQRHCSTTGMANARWTPEKVAALVLDAVRRDRVYVLPQASAKLIWLFKRISPAAYLGFFAFLMRMGWARGLMLRMVKAGF